MSKNVFAIYVEDQRLIKIVFQLSVILVVEEDL
jgi:hypothetical protein